MACRVCLFSGGTTASATIFHDHVSKGSPQRTLA
ncbi:hypothetical protein BRADI_3g29165v3 [Brachypodium distachyon]|uniref:Uncharacterized protein n=1 Tax=Brachypodium distachyon TaxID=15368 RepID=A0A0Q3FBS6_BRADI|nr:hypothetical protein BRADI_3g29165v3 [Brachypodium distachyon]